MVAQPAARPKRPRLSRRASSIVLCTTLLLASCTGPTPSPSAEEPQTGGTIRLAVPPHDQPFLATVRFWLDPGGPSDFSNWFLRCCVARTLLSYDVDRDEGGGAELVPDLATELPTVSSDGLAWTFHLRAGLRYAPPFDDIQVTSPDLARAIERKSLEEPILPAVEGLDEFVKDPSVGLAGLETPDDLTLVVRLTHADGDLGHRMALGGSSPIPEAALKNDGRTLSDFVSTGPYMVESASEAGAVLVRNPSWSRSSDSLRPAYVDRIELVPMASEEEALQRVESGTLDFAMNYLSPGEYRRALHQGEGDRVVSAQANFILHVPLNVANQPLDDVHVRRALALLLDRQALTDLLESGRGSSFEVADHILPDIVVNGLLAGYDPLAAAGASGSVAAAQAEMRQSRYDADGDGRCDDPSCDRIVVAPFFGEAGPAEVIAGQLSALGMKGIVVENTGLPEPGSYHMLAIAGWGAAGPMPSDYGPLWAASDPEDFANLSLVGASRATLRRLGYRASVPSLDAQIQFCTEHTGSSAFRCWAELDQLVMEQVVSDIPIATSFAAYRISDRVTVVMSFTEAIPALDSVQVISDAAPSG
jgi:ABC-type transport system substrate-binding protein